MNGSKALLRDLQRYRSLPRRIRLFIFLYSKTSAQEPSRARCARVSRRGSRSLHPSCGDLSQAARRRKAPCDSASTWLCADAKDRLHVFQLEGHQYDYECQGTLLDVKMDGF